MMVLSCGFVSWWWFCIMVLFHECFIWWFCFRTRRATRWRCCTNSCSGSGGSGEPAAPTPSPVTLAPETGSSSTPRATGPHTSTTTPSDPGEHILFQKCFGLFFCGPMIILFWILIRCLLWIWRYKFWIFTSPKFYHGSLVWFLPHKTNAIYF